MTEHTKSPHVSRLMGGAKHSKGNAATAILMRGHHAMGGAAAPMPMMRKAAPNLVQKYNTGGNVRSKHADGGPTSLEGVTSMDTPQDNAMNPQQQPQQTPAPLKRGGRACHAMGGSGKVRKDIMTEKGAIR